MWKIDEGLSHLYCSVWFKVICGFTLKILPLAFHTLASCSSASIEEVNTWRDSHSNEEAKTIANNNNNSNNKKNHINKK